MLLVFISLLICVIVMNESVYFM